MRFFLLLIILILVEVTSGKTQVLRFEEVAKLLSSINSEAEEGMPLISSDGKTMYFFRLYHKENKGGKLAGPDIWMSKKKDSIWSEATNLGVFNNKKNNAVIGIRDGGKTLYLFDSYGGTVHGIAFTRFIDNKWTKPENIHIKGLSKEGYKGFYMNSTYDVLLITMEGQDSYGEEDIYISLKDKSNQWSQPHNLGATVNSSGFEISPFLSSDKKYLFFSSNGHPGFGDADIFVSERLYDSWDIWSVPKNLGPVVNSVKFDAYFTIALDSTVYFTSNRSSNFADIYKTSFFLQKKDESQARIDSLIKEANLFLDQIKSSITEESEELILLFEYNEFNLKESYSNILDNFLNKFTYPNRVIIKLVPFSSEDYPANSVELISFKRTQSVKQFLQQKGFSLIETEVATINNQPLENYSSDNIGGLRIIVIPR